MKDGCSKTAFDSIKQCRFTKGANGRGPRVTCAVSKIGNIVTACKRASVTRCARDFIQGSLRAVDNLESWLCKCGLTLVLYVVYNVLSDIR